jgi:hypothetical protein
MDRKAEWNAAQQDALDWLAEKQPGLSRDHMTLWDFHEPSWREYRSSQWYVDLRPLAQRQRADHCGLCRV